MHDSPRVLDARALIVELWERLARVQRLSFAATPGAGSRTGWAGHGQARVRCEVEARAIRFFERGQFMPAGSAQRLAFDNVYCWRARDAALALAHERFGRANPVPLFELVADGHGGLASASAHRCGDDRYRARLALTASGFCLTWRISGPAKDERLVYRYFTDADTPHG